MTAPDGKSALLYSLAVLVLSFTGATFLRELVSAYGADLFWGCIAGASVVGGFASAVFFLKEAGGWSTAKWGVIVVDTLGFLLCSTFFFAVALHVIYWQWVAR